MVVCPLCEHAQSHGDACDVCGKPLGSGRAAAPPAVPMEGLERTGHAPADVRSAILAELEPTRHPLAPGARGAVIGDLEPARAAPVDVDVAPLADLEPTSAALTGEPRTALPALAMCRYCRTPALPGERMCARCGMRLPAMEKEPRDAAAEPEGWRCSCGTLARGGLCPSCGARRVASP